MRKISFLLSLLLVGCQATQAPVIETPLPEPVAVEEVTPEPVIVEPPKPKFIMANIMNLAPGTVQNILGVPLLKRKDKNVQVWLYRNSECILNLYFYPDENNDLKLDYVDTDAVGLTVKNPTVSPNACLNSHILETEEPSTEAPEPSSADKNTDPQPGRLDN